MQKKDWIKQQCMLHPKADGKVLEFLAGVRFHGGEAGERAIRSLFAEGYCLHFARMMRETFGRGEVCLLYPGDHFVWVDGGVAYDIDGVHAGCESLIPEKGLGDMKKDFLHIPGEYCEKSEQEIAKELEKMAKKIDG